MNVENAVDIYKKEEKRRKKITYVDETMALRGRAPHLVQSRWVCASLQQQAHDLGLVRLNRHVKGRLSILQVRKRDG